MGVRRRGQSHDRDHRGHHRSDRPVASDDAQAGWITADTTVAVTATDTITGVAGIDWVRTESGDLPADFPDDVPVPEGNITSTMATEGNFTVVIEISDEAADVYAWPIDTVGDHTLEYWALDFAGNESAHEVHSVRVSPSLTDYVEVAGADRYATAVAASQHSFPDGSNSVIIATGSNWPDALGGAALAGVYDAPVLLTRPDALSAAVADEIVRLDPNHVFVLGGTAVVAEAVEAEIRSLIVPTANLERFWGADRFATSNVIAHRVVRDSAVFSGTAFIATGHSFPDALAAAPLATALERPLYLAGKNGLATATLEAMLDSGVTDVVILGGNAAVPAGVEAQLDGAAIAHVRVAGENRYATAIDIATHGVAAGMTWDKSALACGSAFPDALSGGVMQGHDDAVIMLTKVDALDAGVAAKLTEQRDIIGEFRFMGGTTAVSQAVRDEVKHLLR